MAAVGFASISNPPRRAYPCCAILAAVGHALRYPHVRLNIYYKTMDELMDMLSARKIDFVLAFRPVTPYADIESHILFDNHLSAIVSEENPLAQKDKITLLDIVKYDIALPTKGLQAGYAKT